MCSVADTSLGFPYDYARMAGQWIFGPVRATI